MNKSQSDIGSIPIEIHWAIKEGLISQGLMPISYKYVAAIINEYNKATGKRSTSRAAEDRHSARAKAF